MRGRPHPGEVAEENPVVNPIDPTATGFLLAENRNMPMHVGGLQLFEKPEGAGRSYVREMYEQMRDVEQIAPLFLKHPHRSARTAGQLVWQPDEQFDIEHHVRHSALPKPGRIRELLELCSRLHSTRLAWERPLWEAHVIEGLRDGRVAMYTKTHHALVDGVSAMRLLASVLSTDPDERNMPAPWAMRPRKPREEQPSDGGASLADVSATTVRTALAIASEAAGMPGALIRTLNKSVRNETSALSLYAPRTILNQNITGSRRFAAQDWPVERLRAVGKSTGTTINDVVLAMVSGAMRTYLADLDALPETTLVSMVPVGLNAKSSQLASAEGGNAVGSVMVQLGTHLPDPAAPAHGDPQVDEGRQGGPVGDDAGADPRDERARPGAGDPRPGLPDAGHRAPAVQPHRQQRPRPAHHALLERREAHRHLSPVDPDQRHGAQHHLHVLRRQDVLRPDRLPAHRPPPAGPAPVPRRRAEGPRGAAGV